MQIQYIAYNKIVKEVVICFKFSNFAYANTVTLLTCLLQELLLFALNLVTLLMQIQYIGINGFVHYSCYLL